MTLLVIHEIFRPSTSNGFDLFWASTRVFPPYGFSEYPLWSILFADLHAHVIALPFTMLFLGLLFEIGSPLEETPKRIVHRSILGLVLGSLFLLNIWDFLTYSVFFVILNLTASISRFRKHTNSAVRAIPLQILNGAIDLLLPLLVAGSIITIYNLSTPAPPPVGWGWIYREELLPFDSYWRMFGIQLVVLLASLAIACSPSIIISSKLRLAVAIASGMLVFTIPIIRIIVVTVAKTLNVHGINGAPESSYPLLVYSLSAILVFYAVIIERFNGLLAALLILSAGIFCGVETIYIIDRMNTIFKFFNAQWFILSFAACLALFIALTVTKERGRIPVFHAVLYTIISLAILTGFFGGICDVVAMASFHRVAGQRPSLNGMAFLEETKSEELKIINFLNETTRSPERRTLPILEAYGNSYGDFTRIAMYTGLPTLIGWDHHVKQRGLSESELQRRKDAVRTIYSTTDAEQAHTLLRENRIALVVIGPLEHQTYPMAGLAKFDNHEKGFKEVYKQGRYAVFEVLP
jgi:YYY domain-containing protein